MRELELQVEMENGDITISDSLLFPLSCFLSSPCMILRVYFSLDWRHSQLPIPSVLALDLLSEAMHSFLQGVFLSFPGNLQ